jgi:hypothetical protein
MNRPGIKTQDFLLSNTHSIVSQIITMHYSEQNRCNASSEVLK